MSRFLHSLVARGFLGFGVLLAVLLLSGALVSAQPDSPPDPLSADRLTATSTTPQPSLPLPTATSTDALPAYPGSSLAAPTPTPWLTSTLVPPVVFPTLGPSTTPTAVVPPATPTSAPTDEATATALPTPSLADYDDPAYVARLPRVPQTHGQINPGAGGQIDAGPLHLDVPGNAYHHPLAVDVETQTTYPRLKPSLTPRLLFTIHLTDILTNAPVYTLDTPSELRMNLAAVPGFVVDGVNIELYSLDPTTLEWEPVPSTLRGTALVASVTQFSAFSLTTDYGKDWQPQAKTDTVNVDLFTGSTALSIPLDVPDGTARMMPHLTLSYSSVVADQINDVLARKDALANESPSTQADWVGLGWSLDLGRITSVVTGIDQVTPVKGSAPNIPTYYLELNGTREKLICITPNCQDHKAKTDALAFKTERDSYLRIIRRYTPSLGKNDHDVWWEVWDRSGTYYRFGYSYNSEHLRGWAQYGGGEDNTWGGAPAWGYSLDRVVDTHGNRMDVEYFQDWYWPDGNVHSQNPDLKNKCEIGTKQRVLHQFRLPDHGAAGGVRAVELSKTWVFPDPGAIVYPDGFANVQEYAYDDYGNVTDAWECTGLIHLNDPDPGRYNCAPSEKHPVGHYARYTKRWFEPRSTPDANAPGQYSYIVDKAVVEGVYGDVNVGPWWPKVTYFSYDGRNALPWSGDDFVPGVAGPTTKGELTWMRRVDCWRCAPETTADTHYDYDAYGNRTIETTWDQFSVNGATIGTARPVTTTYESALHTFVEQITQPHTVVYEKAGWDDTAYRWQAPSWIEDGNGSGSRVTYTYDDFGRRRDITRPGDTNATEHYDYVYNPADTARLSVSAKKRLDAERVITSTVFYDGLGRSLLTKTEHPGAAGQAQAVATYYDNRGLKSAETQPYWPGTFNICGGNDTCFGGRPTPGSPTLKYSTYQYDVFGAPTLTVRPDGTTSVVTRVREQRQTYTAERGPLFDISGLNPSFETAGGGICAQGWTCGEKVAERVGTGVVGRFALRVGTKDGSGPVRAEASTTYGSVVLPQGWSFTLSWLARRMYGNPTLRAIVKVNGVEAPGAADYPVTAPPLQWQLFHRTFTVPTDGNTLTVGFEVPAGTVVDIDGLQMTWGDVRERSEETDGLGRTTRVEERTDVADRLATTYAYDPLDRVISVTDSAGNTTRSSRLDPTNDRTRLDRLTVDDPDRGTWTYQYDPQGNVTLQTDGRGQQVSYTYDSLDRLIGKSYPNDPSTTTVTYTYDDGTLGAFRKGRRSQMSVGGDTVTYTYDGRGRVTQETRGVGGLSFGTGYGYNSADKVTSQTYPDGEAVSYTYTSAGRITNVSGVLHAATTTYLASQTYDVAGNPEDATLGNGARTRARYDDASQRLTLLETVVKADGQDSDDPALKYFYDPFGNVTFIQNVWQPSENQSFNYDTLNRLTTVDGPFAQTFAYDDLGNLTRRDAQTYRYKAGKPHAVSHLGTDAAPRFGYDPAGNLTSRGSQRLVYDAEGRLTTVASGATELETYRYDGDGALTRRTVTPLSAQALYSQDFASQAASWTSASSGSGSVTWGVNPNDVTTHTTTLRLTGNATDWTVETYRNGVIGDMQQARVAFKLSQTGSGAVIALESSDEANYIGVYEEQGTLYLRTRVGASYTNQLTLMSGVDPAAWYVLELAADEAAGFRVSVWQESTPGMRYEARYEMPQGLSWRFHAWAYRGSLYLDGPLQDGAYKEERRGQPASDVRVVGQHYEYDTAANAQTKRYYAEGKLLATRTGATLTYVQADHLGSTSTLTDAGGQAVGRERYSAFGERRRGETPPTTDHLYTGQRLNALSNLYHYTDGTSAGRFYDPLLARFIQPDSVTPGKSSQALNRYAYSVNNPVRYIDPTGHAFKDDNPGGEWGSPIAVNAVYDDQNFDLFKRIYPDYNVEYDPVLNNIEETPWAYMDVKGTRSAIQVTQGRWALEHGVAGWQTLMLAGTAGLALGVVGISDSGGNVEPISAPELSIAAIGEQPLPQLAYHYTRAEFADAIAENGLRSRSGQIFTTPQDDLSPLQAQIDLALPPNRGLSDAVYEVDLAGLRQAGYRIGSPQLAARHYNMPGGGTEIIIHSNAVPPQFLRRIR